MQPLTDLQFTTAALRAALSVASPRGSTVLEVAGAVGRAARRAGYGPTELSLFLGQMLLPVLRTHHPGPGGDWLWERVVVAVRDAHAATAVARDAGGTTRAVAMADAAAAAAVARRRTRDEPPVVSPVSGSPSASLSAVPPVVYRVDADDVIIRVNAAWGPFAAANGAPALAAQVVGTSLWAHVGGEETRQLYGAVYETVRRSGRAVVLPFRCDAPTEQRWMQLSIRPLGRGHLQVASTQVRRAARPRVPLLDPTVPRGAMRLRMCSWCKRVRLDRAPAAGPHAWIDAEAVDRVPLDGALRGGAHAEDAPPDARPGSVALPPVALPHMALPQVAHDVCPDCAANVRATLASA